MAESEDLHKLSENVYRHLEKSFCPGLRNIIATGKAYYEALAGLNSPAKNHIEALLKVGHSCKTTSKGSTQALGDALFAIADTYRQIQVQVEEANKALWSEFLLPLEGKVETQFKEIVQGHKRYVQGHKSVHVSYEKADVALKKARKKSKSKRSANDMQEVEDLKEWSEKLIKFRSQGLKLALLEERKHYCYLLDKCCSMAKITGDVHIRAGSMLGRPLPTWQGLCEDPMTLPPESAALISYHSGGVVHLSPMHNGHAVSPHHAIEYNKNSMSSSYVSHAPDQIVREDRAENDTLMTVAPPTSHSPQVRAVYNHSGDGDNQLSFTEGDVIVLIGDKSEGWHYGLNTTNNRCGWFPLSYVEPLDKGDRNSSNSSRQRHRSVGDLHDADNADQRSNRRPTSMYSNQPPPGQNGIQSNETTGSDTYQEPGVGTYGDGKPDFWMRGTMNNQRINGTRTPQADYNDHMAGYRGRRNSQQRM